MHLRTTSFFFLLVLVGCSSGGDLRYHMPITRLETPEVAGRSLGVATEFGVVGAQSVRLGKARLPGSTYQFDRVKRVTDAYSAAFNLRVGIRESFEAIMRVRAQAPVMWGGKWQFKGTSRLQRVKGWKMGLALLGGGQGVGSSDSSRGNEYQSDARVTAGEVNYLVGYRESEDVMFYGVTALSYYGVSGKMSDRSADTLEVNGWSKQYAQTIGLELACGRLRCKLEGGIANANYRDNVNTTHGSWGAGADFFW